ncbi:type V secretion protein A [Budvicia aquatica]|uniref:Type V secretion protein A n=3 Tax=Budvicia aquatica TaxID=82979 RepID=A0A2C6C8U2_9GAMM|nr:type V secretion protein A [Budvicia aquatica]
MQLGKTDVVINFADGATGSSYISAVRLKNGSTGSLPAALAQTVTAEFGAGSTFIINGNNHVELIGIDIEAGLYTPALLLPDMTAFLNENTTVTLNKAGNSSVGLYSYISGGKIKTKDGLLVNVNTDNHSTVYGIRAQGISTPTTVGGVVELEGTSTINIVNGGTGSTGILAHQIGGKVTALKRVTINNTTTDSTAMLYGLWASKGVIDFSGPTAITLDGGDANSSAIAATSAGTVTLTGAMVNAGNGRAFYASGQDSVLTGNAAQYNATGTIMSSSNGVIDLTMTEGSTFTGTSLFGTTPGTTNLTMSGTGSVWNMTGDSTLSNLTLDGATLKYNDTSTLNRSTFTPKMLTIAGNYASNGGTLVLNTVLEDDTSTTDKLVVKGDTSGHTNVVITNIGGNGALTTNGIEIVQVLGNSVGTFNNSGRIVAGAFDYFVRPGTAISGANANNWYLISDYSPVIPPIEPIPVVPELPVIKPIAPESPAVPVINAPVYRPEAGSYLANQSAANTLFMTRLHDRLGETQYTDVLTGEQKVTSLWMRNVGGHNRFRDGSGQLRTTSNRYVLQLGGDIVQWSNNDLDRLHLGVMAGYGSNNSKTQSKVTDYASKGKVDGYSAGVYGTWYANETDKTGVYVDSWVLYNWFDNEVKGDYLGTENYKSRGVTASLEGGYSFKLGQHEQASYWLQPKAQVVWMGVSANDRRESNGTGIKHETDNNLMTRLGLRAYMNGHNRIDDGKDRTFQPFIEANWIYNTENYTVKMNNVSNSQAGAKNRGELKVGVEGQLNTRLNVWGNVAQQMGDKGYSDTQAMLGVKYSF